jgi:hypothetical protein
LNEDEWNFLLTGSSGSVELKFESDENQFDDWLSSQMWQKIVKFSNLAPKIDIIENMKSNVIFCKYSHFILLSHKKQLCVVGFVNQYA